MHQLKPKTKTQKLKPKIILLFLDFFIKKIYYYFGFFWNNLTKKPVFTKKLFWVLVFGFMNLVSVDAKERSIVWTKIPTKLLLDFCPEFFCSFLGASWKLFGLPGELVCNIINKEAYRNPQKASRKPPGRYKKFQGRNSEIISLIILSKRWNQKDILKLTDLYHEDKNGCFVLDQIGSDLSKMD